MGFRTSPRLRYKIFGSFTVVSKGIHLDFIFSNEMEAGRNSVDCFAHYLTSDRGFVQETMNFYSRRSERNSTKWFRLLATVPSLWVLTGKYRFSLPWSVETGNPGLCLRSLGIRNNLKSTFYFSPRRVSRSSSLVQIIACDKESSTYRCSPRLNVT